MSEAYGLRYIERDSWMHRADAISKLVWLFSVAIAMFTFSQPLAGTLMLCAVLFLTLVVARIPLRTVWNSALLIFGVATLLGLFHVFNTVGAPIWQWAWIAVSAEGLVKGAGFFLRLSVVVLASFLFIWTTDIRDLMVGLVRLGLSYRFAFAIFMALRFLPLVQQEVEHVRAAHAIRGRAAQSPLRHRFRLWQRYLFTVIVNGLRKAEGTAIAIESRGFGAYPTRTFVKDFHWSVAGIVLCVASWLGITALWIWERGM